MTLKLFLAGCCYCLLAATRLPIAAAQSPDAAQSQQAFEEALARNRIEPQTEEFRQAIEALREHIKAMRRLIVKYNVSLSSELDKSLIRQFNDMLPRGRELHHAMIQAALAEYQADPQNRPKIADMLNRLVKREVDQDRYEGILDAALALHENGYPNPDLPKQITMTALAMNEYDVVERFKSQLPNAEVTLPKLRSAWERELELRKQDAQGEPLPRVLLRTSKGDMEIELFENQAPETVANFIDLVERKFYDGLTFHRVAEHFAIQTGCPFGDGSGDDGYKIYSESQRPDARGFFRGTLGMALNNGELDSAGTQFFITYLPAPEIQGTFTAFGRVTEGIETLGNLVKIDPEAEKSESDPPQIPDIIFTAEVLQKRDHPYQPNKVTP